MHVRTTTRRSGENEYNATLLRRSYRQDGKVKKETLANLSHLPPEAIDAIRAVLAGKTVMSVDQAFEIERSLPAGHVTAALTMARRLGLAKLLDCSPCRERDLCVAMIVGRVIGPGSKLGNGLDARPVNPAKECGVVGADEDDLYAAMDWLVERQDRIEDRLAARHLRDGEMVLYDVSSSTSRVAVPAGKRRYRGREARPAADHLRTVVRHRRAAGRGRGVHRRAARRQTLPSQVVKLKDRFGLRGWWSSPIVGWSRRRHHAAVRDRRGGSITALKAPTIRNSPGPDDSAVAVRQQNLGRSPTSRSSPANDWSCAARWSARNVPASATNCCATEIDLAAIARRLTAGTLTGADLIGLTTGPALKRYRMRERFQTTILTPRSPTPARPRRSPRKLRSTGSTSCGPPHRDRPSDR